MKNRIWVTRSAKNTNSFAHEYIHLWTHSPVRQKAGDYFGSIGKMISIESQAFAVVFGYLPECDTIEQKIISLEDVK